MAKFLSLNGLKYFINRIIGKTDITKIGDGTLTGAVKKLSYDNTVNSDFVVNFKNRIKTVKINETEIVAYTDGRDEFYHGILIIENKYIYAWMADSSSANISLVWKQSGASEFPVEFTKRTIETGALELKFTFSSEPKVATCINFE